jgi:hypothetical protein
MKTSEEFDNPNGGKIHIAEVKKGGNSSWGERKGCNEDSIRLAWYNKDGGFDPISSAELPLWGLKDLVQEAAKRNMLSKADLAEIIGHLTASVYRQS